MDNRRWNTAQSLTGGVLNIPAPEAARPANAVLQYVEEDDLSADTLLRGLERGGLEASMYYGTWSIWKTTAGFSGQLFQYHVVTDSFTDEPLESALEKAEEWAWGCFG